MTTLRDLAERYNMEPRKLRRILRNEGIKRRKTRWQWKDGRELSSLEEDILDLLTSLEGQDLDQHTIQLDGDEAEYLENLLINL